MLAKIALVENNLAAKKQTNVAHNDFTLHFAHPDYLKSS